MNDLDKFEENRLLVSLTDRSKTLSKKKTKKAKVELELIKKEINKR